MHYSFDLPARVRRDKEVQQFPHCPKDVICGNPVGLCFIQAYVRVLRSHLGEWPFLLSPALDISPIVYKEMHFA